MHGPPIRFKPRRRPPGAPNLSITPEEYTVVMPDRRNRRVKISRYSALRGHAVETFPPVFRGIVEFLRNLVCLSPLECLFNGLPQSHFIKSAFLNQ